MTKPYMSSVHETATAEYVIKKSRFISNLFHVTTEEEAQRRVAEMKKKYWDARHNCYAYRLGPVFSLQKASDDGEPSGTAGKPVLEVLKAWELTDTLIVVTRYFGGIKLGTGGLIRAYGHAAALGLDASRPVRCLKLLRLAVTIDYPLLAVLENFVRQNNLRLEDTIYGEKVQLLLLLEKEQLEPLEATITDLTAARASCELLGETWGRIPL